MKKIIFVVFMVVMVSTPCLAVIETAGIGTIDGTAWTAVNRNDLNFAFFNEELYVNCMWMGLSEIDCENGELLPLDSVIREPGRIGFSIHFSSFFSTQIYRFEVIDLEDNTGTIELWHITLWPSRPNYFFIFSPELIDGDKFLGLGVYRHYTYGSSWENESPIFLFKVDDNWTP